MAPTVTWGFGNDHTWVWAEVGSEINVLSLFMTPVLNA